MSSGCIIGYCIKSRMMRSLSPPVQLELGGNFIIFNNGIGEMRAVDIAILYWYPLASAHQWHHLGLLCYHIHIFYWHVDIWHFCILCPIDLLGNSEKSQKPPVNVGLRFISPLIRVFSLVVDIVPELNVRVSFVSWGELFQNKQPVNILLQSSIHIKLPQEKQLFLKVLPVFKLSSHVGIHYTTAFYHSGVFEELLEAVHDDGSWHNQWKLISWTEIALQFLGNTRASIFPDSLDHLLKELSPILVIYTKGFNDKLFLALMINKGFPELLGMFVNILWKVEHDGQPNIIRSKFEVTMVDVGLIEGLVKSVGVPFN